MHYEPTWSSVRRHPVPGWFHDAKLGIFVHWGVYSVPGWAPVAGEPAQVVAHKGWSRWFAENPYAEWYLNSIRIAGSPSQKYHLATYGAGFAYEDFVPVFELARRSWEPESWAELFRKAGARYVVFTTKHHDGFLLWPSQHLNPRQEDYHAMDDLVGMLADAVRARGMRMGLYYSGGIDWTFNATVIHDITDLLVAVPRQPEYAAYADCHWRELVERYEPAILWNDIAYPAAADLPRLFADYYNQIPDGVVNDRFFQSRIGGCRLLGVPPVRAALGRLAGWVMSRAHVAPPTGGHHDFRTPEYALSYQLTEHKWEATRGIGHSFGFNQQERPDIHLTLKDLVHSFIDIVSKNGNLLLNVGPQADGRIPDVQRDRLLGLGTWLQANGEAIFAARPWARAEGRTREGNRVRFTQRSHALYAAVLAAPESESATIEALRVPAGSTVHMLGHCRPLSWREDGQDLQVNLPDGLRDSVREAPAYVLKITS